MQNNSKFAELKSCNNIWAIGSIHSHRESFENIKEHIIKNFSTNDRIIFLGVPINDYVANIIQAQLLFLESVDSKKDILIY